MSEKLKFKEVKDPISLTQSFWYMLTDGGYIKPEKILEAEDAAKVKKAINLISSFYDQGIEKGHFEQW